MRRRGNTELAAFGIEREARKSIAVEEPEDLDRVISKAARNEREGFVQNRRSIGPLKQAAGPFKNRKLCALGVHFHKVHTIDRSRPKIVIEGRDGYGLLSCGLCIRMREYAYGIEAVLAGNIQVQAGLPGGISQREMDRRDVAGIVELKIAGEQAEGLPRGLEGKNPRGRRDLGSEKRINANVRANIEKDRVRGQKAGNQSELAWLEIGAGPDSGGNGSFGSEFDRVAGEGCADGSVAQDGIAYGKGYLALQALNVGGFQCGANFTQNLSSASFWK